MLRLLHLRRWFSRGLSFLRDPHVPVWKKGLALFAVVYVVSPIDVIPDMIPILGWMDDLGVLAIAGTWLAREIDFHATAAEQGVPRPLNVEPEGKSGPSQRVR